MLFKPAFFTAIAALFLLPYTAHASTGPSASWYQSTIYSVKSTDVRSKFIAISGGSLIAVGMVRKTNKDKRKK